MAVTKIRKISSTVLLVIALITIVVFAMFLFGGYIDPTAAKPEPRFTNLLLYLCYVALIVAVLALIGFGIWGFAGSLRTNRKAALGGLLALVALVALLAITYAIGSTEHLSLSGDFAGYNTDHYLKLSDMWLFSIYIMLGLTVIAMIWGAIYTSMKKKK